MTHEEEVLRIGKKLDKMVAKKTTEQAAEVLKALQRIPVTLETLQKTRIGMSVNSVRKQTSSDEVAAAAKQLIKGWKKLVPEIRRTDVAAENSSSHFQAEESLHSFASKLARKEGEAPVKKSDSSKSLKEEANGKKNKIQREDSSSIDVESTATVGSNGSVDIRQTLATTNNPVRDKCREMLMRGLETEASSESEKSRCQFLSAVIEESIFNEFRDTGVKYKNRVRSRYSNLKDVRNPVLRQNVLTGVISPDKLAKMTPEEMASTEMKSMREKFEEENIKDHQMAVNEGTKTDMFVCGKCKGRCCTYNQLQTRSADEPMTTFVFCTECGNRWKFC